MTPIMKTLRGTSMLHPNASVLRDPITGTTALFTTFSAGVATTIFVPTIFVTIGTSLITSWVLKALLPKPKVSGSQGMLTNGLDGTAPQQYVYGQVRKGGTITFYEATGTNNKFLHMILCLAGHEVEEIGDIYINDEVVTIDGSNLVTSSPWNSKIRIKKHLGSATQVADSDLVSETSATEDFRGQGIAYLYVRFEYNQDVFANGIPTITAVVKGKKVYDPRTTSTAWTKNAALCVRDYLTDERGLQDSGIDDTLLSVSANICDEAVTLDAGGTEKRYEMNGVISSDATPETILQSMTTSCAGTLFRGQGAWKLKVGYYTSPVKTFTLDDIRGPIKLQTRVSMSDNFNAVQGTFNDATQDWITVDFPKLQSATFVAEDGGIETPIDMELPFTTSSPMAQRIAKLTLFRGREQMTFTADFGLSALDVQVGDIVALDMDRYGWSGKEFEVTNWQFFSDQENGDLRVSMSLRETSEAAFDWSAEEQELIGNNTNLPSPWSTPSVGVSLTSETRVLFEKLTNVISVSVTSDDLVFVERVEVQFKKSANATWNIVGVGEPGVFEILDVSDDFYDVRVRSYNQFGIRGDWEYYYNFQVSGLAAPPEDVTSFHGQVNGSTVTLEWVPVSDLDLSYYWVRHAIEESGASFANATNAVKKVPRPGSSVVVPARPGTYMVKAIDKSGNASVNYTSLIVPSAALETFTTNLTQTDSPTFGGTKTNTSVTSGALRLTSGTSGEYQFSTYIDTGAVRRVRSRVDVNTTRYDPSLGTFDALPGLFDALPGLFDDFTGGNSIADTDVLMYISMTNDDPAGTPTWGDWQQYKAGDFYGRAFRFKVELVSEVSGVTPSITGLTARVSYN